VLRQLFELIRSFLFLARDVQDNRSAVQELRRDVAELQEITHRLARDLELLQQREQHEREKLALQFENAFLRMERRLPGPKQGRKRS
jgi:hypothetical protein